MRPGPTRWAWPTSSSRVRGRMRSASGWPTCRLLGVLCEQVHGAGYRKPWKCAEVTQVLRTSVSDGQRSHDLVTLHPATRVAGPVVANDRFSPLPDLSPDDVARALLTLEGMLVEVVFQYRTLIGKCELGVGLEWDEIEQVTLIESAFAPTADDRRMRTGRRFRRESIEADGAPARRPDQRSRRRRRDRTGWRRSCATHRSSRAASRSRSSSMTVTRAIASARRACGCKDDGDDYRVGLAADRHAGVPAQGRAQPRTTHDLVDKISAAA